MRTLTKVARVVRAVFAVFATAALFAGMDRLFVVISPFLGAPLP